MFLGAEIPAFDPALSLKEVNRIAGNPAVKGIALPTSMINKDYVFEPAFEPVLARCAELGYPLLFHPLDGEVHEYGGTQTRIDSPLTEDTFIYNTLGFPWDTATVASLFIVTGLLDKYPNLQVVLPHAGGVFPYVAGRVQHGIERRKFPLKRPFREYGKQFYYDTMTYYPETMRFLIDFAGVDHVLIGTDNGYNSSALDHSSPGTRQARYEWPNSIVEMMKLPKDQEEAILRGNAVKLFKL
jgi:aminocarboxymuconate-semialdehyde decarboxylase